LSEQKVGHRPQSSSASRFAARVVVLST
jgi:hypothetical protein